MRILGITLYIILGVWAIFGVNTDFIRYIIGDMVANPVKSSCFYLTAIILLTLIIKGYINPLQSKMAAIEPVLGRMEKANFPIKNLDGTFKYLRIYQRLLSSPKNLTDIQKIEKFIDDSRYIFNNAPDCLKEKFSTRNLNMQRVTQISVLKIKKYRHTLLFVSHDEALPDKQIKVFTFDVLSEFDSLKTFLNPIFSESILKTMRNNFDDWMQNKITIHGTDGFAATGDSNHPPKWLWLGIPDPFENFNLNTTLALSVGFTKNELSAEY